MNVNDLLFYSLDRELKLWRRHVSFQAAARFVKRRIKESEDPTITLYVYDVEARETTDYTKLTVRAVRGGAIKQYKPEG